MINPSHSSRRFRPHACEKCGGDPFFDAGEALEWRCLQCGKPMALNSVEKAESMATQWNWIPTAEPDAPRRRKART